MLWAIVSMKYARQINIDLGFSIADILARTRIMAQHGKAAWNGNSESAKLIRRFVPKRFIKQLKDRLPAEIVPYIQGIHLTETQALACHLHTRDFCVLNFYHSVNGEATIFWEGDAQPIDVANDNGNLYITVDTTNLTVAEQFVAKSGDIWLLNTLQPHSTSLVKDGGTRTILQVFLGLPFDEVVNYFYDTNSNSSQTHTH